MMNLSVYPICKGKNWGYGSAQGSQINQLILDLSNMNQITKYEESLAYVSIQPGVTQVQLADYLQARNSDLQMDVTGAPKDTSLMGNYLERGFGHTYSGNRYQSILNMKALLPSGKIIQTGFGAFENFEKHHNIFRAGIGPCLEGLFSQSNLGIVIEMTTALQPRPKHFCMFGLFCKEEKDLAPLVDTLRELRLHGILNSTVRIANQARAMGETTSTNLGAWILTGAISGDLSLVKAKKKLLKATFKDRLKAHKLLFFTDKKIQYLEWINRYVKKIPIMDGIRAIRDLQQGIPTNQPTLTLFQEKEEVPNFAQDFESNFLRINATCNALGKDVERLKKITSDFFEHAGYSFRVTFTSITPRSLIMIADIQYDKTPIAIEAAKTFYQRCLDHLIQEGFYPYRSGSGGYHCYAKYLDQNHYQLLQRLKHSLDQNNIIAPQKYNLG